jgi:hypothetical protein
MSLLESIRVLFVEKPSVLAGEMGDIHPIHEAVVALLKSQVSDSEAQQCLQRTEKDAIKEIIVADVFMGRVRNETWKNELRAMLREGKPLELLIDKAALYLSENKRVHEGDVLYRPSLLPADTRRYVEKRTKGFVKNHPNSIYIQKGVIDYVDANKRRFKRNKRIGYALIGAISLGLAYGTWDFTRKYDLKVVPQQTWLEMKTGAK